jgi:hypothetical protein
VLFSTVPTATCSTSLFAFCVVMLHVRMWGVSSLYMHVCDDSNKILCTPFQAKHVSNTRAETACDYVTKLRTVHHALSTKLMQLCYMYAPRATPPRPPRPPLRRRGAPPQWWSGWAGQQMHGNMQAHHHAAHVCRE